MKNWTVKGTGCIVLTLCLGVFSTVADTITWDDGAADDNWSSGTNWSGTPDNTSPVSGDSVVLTATTQSFLDYSWTIQNGQSLTSSTSEVGDDMGIGRTDTTVGSLRLESGGIMDIGFLRPRSTAASGSGNNFIIEAGASLDTDRYGLGSRTLDITYIADAAGVTLWNNSTTAAGQFALGGDTLTVDLSAYEVLGTSSLILMDYAAANVLSGTFANVNVIGTDDWSIDYTTDTKVTLAVTIIPEPSSLALLGMGAVFMWTVRKRMVRT